MPHYTLCADDFGLSPAISETIAALAAAGCVNAVSCMAATPGWRRDARLLELVDHASDERAGVEIGIHLVLAGERPITAMPGLNRDGRLPSADRLLVRALAGRIDHGTIAREIDAQFAAFAEALGRPPDFVDAHQHVHVYPGIRQLVIAATLRHAPQAWLRNPGERIGAALQRPFAGKAIGSSIHALGFARALARAGLAANVSFAGHYDFAGDYAALLPRFFRAASARHLVMCHPGSGMADDDSIAAARIVEAKVLAEMPLSERLAQLGLEVDQPYTSRAAELSSSAK